MLDDVLTRLIERVERQYFGKYRGLVADNADPDKLGRLRATVPSLLGAETTGWALPCVPYGGAAEQGLFAVPDVGAGVWIEFERGDLSYPIWVGTWWASGEAPEGGTPDKKVVKTKAGNSIVLDDTDGSETVLITDASGGSSIRLDADGVTLERDGSTVTLTGDAVEMSRGGMSVKVGDSSVTVNGSSLEVT